MYRHKIAVSAKQEAHNEMLMVGDSILTMAVGANGQMVAVVVVKRKGGICSADPRRTVGGRAMIRTSVGRSAGRDSDG